MTSRSAAHQIALSYRPGDSSTGVLEIRPMTLRARLSYLALCLLVCFSLPAPSRADDGHAHGPAIASAEPYPRQVAAASEDKKDEKAVVDAMKPPKAEPSAVKAKAATVAPAMPKAVNRARARKPAQNVLRAMRQTVRNAPSALTAMKHRVPMAKPQAVAAGVAVAVASVHRVRVSVPTWMPKPWVPKAL